MQPSLARSPQFLGLISIGILQVGVSIYLNLADIDEFNNRNFVIVDPHITYANWQPPFYYISIAVAIVALIALYLIVQRRRVGLKLGLGAWGASSVLTVFFVLMVNAPYPAMRNYFFVNGAISLFVNLAVMYVFAHYLSRPRDKSAFK